MRKIRSLCCVLVILVGLGCFVVNGSMMYGDGAFREDGLRYYPHAVFKTCFAADYAWPEGAAEAVIDLPEERDGYRVTELGGYIGRGLPCPFMVDLPGDPVLYSESALPAGAEIEDYHLTLNIGRSLAGDENVAMDCYYCVGENRFVRILTTVNCSGDNPNFYAEDGRLYRKADDSLVEGFIYRADHPD